MKSHGTRRGRGWMGAGCAALGIALAGCGDDASPGPEPDPACPYTLGGECVGVPTTAGCSGDACAAGVTCTRKPTAADTAQLAAAIGDAQAGDCILLGPGSFGDVILPGGVSLLGAGASQVSVNLVELGAGSGAVVRGVAVGAGGVSVAGATDARIEEVRVTGASGHGVLVQGAASATLARSEVLGAAGSGLRIVSGALAVESSVIADGAGPGVVALCEGGCDCAEATSVSLTKTLVTNNSHVGLFVSGAAATLAGAAVSETRVQGLEANSGGGVVAAECSTLEAAGLEVSNNDFFGVLVDSSSGKLGEPGAANGIIIFGNVMGVWLQGVGVDGPGSFEIQNAVVEENQGVGIGVGGGSKGIIIFGSQVKKTTLRTLVVADGGSKEVGDGVLWTGAAQVGIDGVTVSESARQGVLIDGPVATGSAIAHLTLQAGDETKGVVQQSVEAGAESPTIGADAPPVATQAAQVFEVPQAPAAPAAM